MSGEPWWLILIIWGSKYSDDDCNFLISSAFRHSTNCSGVLVLTDDLSRAIDSRARLASIPSDFNMEELKGGGLPIKLCLFDLPEVPVGAACIYVDLDSAIVGSLDEVPTLLSEAKIWMIDVFPKRFSLWRRLLSRATKGQKFAIGNSSAFLYRNGFTGNPTIRFRDMRNRGTLPKKLLHDDRFVSWSMQQDIRGFSPFLISYFRIEFLSTFMFINYFKSIFRNKKRQGIAVITFAGQQTKVRHILGCKSIVDHHGRVGRWSDFLMGGMNKKVENEIHMFEASKNKPDTSTKLHRHE